MFYFYTIYDNDICQLDQQVMESFLHLKQFDQEFASRDQLQKELVHNFTKGKLRRNQSQ